MKIIELLSELRSHKIQLSLKEGNLEISSYQEKISTDLIHKIKSNKLELITYLKSLNEDSTFHSNQQIPKVESGLASYPVSNSQLRLWLNSQSEESAIANNMPGYVKLDGSYDLDCFQRAINAVIDRHEILRTVFRINDLGEVRQHILKAKDLNFSIQYLDLRGEKNAQETYLSFISEDNQKPFDLKQGPLLRAALLQTAAEQYVFYYNMHHIISDEWSMTILSQDVMSYYHAFQSGTEVDILPLNIQFKDYATWQLDWLKSTASEDYRNFWKTQFTEKVPPINLPSEKPRPLLKTFKGKALGTALSKDLTTRLRDFVVGRTGSLFIGLLTIWKLLLNRYTRETTICVGNPVSIRNHRDLENQLGFYINILPLKHEIDPQLSFEQQFDKIKDNVLNAYKFQQYPFDRLMEDLNLKKIPGRSPLFDTIIDYHGTSPIGFGLMDNEKVNVLNENPVKFDLEMHLTEVDNHLEIVMAYNTDIYEQWMGEQLLLHFKQLVAVLLDKPKEPFNQISLLTGIEQRKLLKIGKGLSVKPNAADSTFLTLLNTQIASTPDAIAVEFGEKKLTYKELGIRSEQLANYLVDEYHVKKGDLIGIHLDRSHEYLIGLIGIMKSGCAYIPIDVAHPVERKKHMLEDAEVNLLIADTTFLFELDYYDGILIAIDALPTDFNTRSQRNIDILPGDLAYIIYTSGSTGKPKGVMIEHQNLANYLQWGKAHYLSDNLKNYNFGWFTSPAFDLTITSMLLPLISGGCLKVFDPQLDVLKVIESYLTSSLSCIKLTPSHINIISHIDVEAPNLEVAIVGGEELKRIHVDILRKINPTIKIYNEYGPTETTVGCTVFKVSEVDSLLCIGKPILNTEVYILDAFGHLVPSGVPGEIHIGGAGVARGYLNRPQLSDEKFVLRSLNGQKRLYNTGDLGKWLQDGNLQFLGRKDQQVKILGHRIELAEIEATLEAINGVRQAVASSIELANGNKHLVAYLVGEELDTNKLRKILLSSLPEYMVPKQLIPLQEIPLTSNGKVDRKALPTPNQTISSTQHYLPPTTSMERTLVEVWQEVLNLNQIGINDNFFELGGNSLEVIKVVALVRKRLDLEIDIQTLFEFNTIQDLAFQIDFKINQQGIKSTSESLNEIEL